MSMIKFVEAITKFNADEQDARQQAEQRAQSFKPTVDESGKYHAPHDNFEWIDGQIYQGGQYLPFEESHTQPMRKLKAKVSVDAFSKLKDVLSNASLGKAWDIDGTRVAYAYLEVPQSLYKVLEKLTPKSGKVLMEVEEAKKKGLSVGSSWKFNLRGVTSRWNEDIRSGTDMFEYYCEDRGIIWGEHLFFNKNETDGTFKNPKNKKSIFYSPLSGKEVCYVYSKDFLA